jgi:hypothetical protein
VNEDRAYARPEHDQRSESAGLALARTRDPLFDHSAAENGSDQTSICVPHSPAQRNIGDAGLVGKPRKRFGFERSHPSSPGLC